LDEYFARLLDFAVAADWGKHPVPHPRGTALAAPGQDSGPRPGPADRDRESRDDAALRAPEPTTARSAED
jgi:hypothetical protein